MRRSHSVLLATHATHPDALASQCGEADEASRTPKTLSNPVPSQISAHSQFTAEAWLVPINLAATKLIEIVHQSIDLGGGVRCWGETTPRPPSDIRLELTMPKRAVLLGAITFIAVSVVPDGARAAENAAGIYLLGAKTAMAGYVPPPGTYVTDINYFYAGDAGGNAARGITLRQTGALLNVDVDINVDAVAYVNAPIALWIAPEKVWGGNVGLGVMVPFGWKGVDVDIDALATLTLPNGTVIQRGRHFDFSDSTTNFGDPVLNALVGWHEGKWHWAFNALLNVPIGPWDTESVTNLSFHRWALDTSGSVTYLDPKSGHEVSVTAGFTCRFSHSATCSSSHASLIASPPSSVWAQCTMREKPVL